MVFVLAGWLNVVEDCNGVIKDFHGDMFKTIKEDI